MPPLSQFYIRILLNGPQDARPGKNRFAYAESPAKQRHDRELPDTAHNSNELGRIRILLPVVSQVVLACVREAQGARGASAREKQSPRSKNSFNGRV